MRTPSLSVLLKVCLILVAVTTAAIPWLRSSPEEAFSTGSVRVLNGAMAPSLAPADGTEKRQNEQLLEKIALLEARLQKMEAERGAAAPRSIPERRKAADKDAKEKRKALSETEFGQWMDDSLNLGSYSPDTTRSVMDKAQENLSRIPDVNLTEVQCSERFCRATLVPEDGKVVNLAEVVGGFSFAGSGFTLEDTDGQVKVYFTQPGQTFDDLQKEAEQARSAPPG